MLRILYPKMYVSSILEIQPALLKELGLKAILFDLDNTIVRIDAERFSPAVAKWLTELREWDFKLAIVSNNSRKRVDTIAGLMDLPSVPRAVKPWVAPFHRAMKLTGTSPRETALVGDQIFTDVLAARLVPVYAILVKPRFESEAWNVRIKRSLEKPFLRNIRFTE